MNFGTPKLGKTLPLGDNPTFYTGGTTTFLPEVNVYTIIKIDLYTVKS